MGREQQAIRLVLSTIVGIGFVMPLVTAVFRMAGFGQAVAILGGTGVGLAVTAYIYPRMTRVGD